MCRCVSSAGATWSRVCTEAAMARVLLAEDEESVRLLVARALSQDGHEVVATVDGAEALDTLQNEHVARQSA